MRVFGMPVVPPVSNTKTGLPASPCGIQRCTGPPRSHSSWNSPKRCEIGERLDLAARIPAGLLREVEPERTCRSRDRSATSTTSRIHASSGRSRVGRAGWRRRAWHRSIAFLAGRIRCARHSARVRAAPGLLVLARGASARVRLPADRPLLSRRLHGRDLAGLHVVAGPPSLARAPRGVDGRASRGLE